MKDSNQQAVDFLGYEIDLIEGDIIFDVPKGGSVE